MKATRYSTPLREGGSLPAVVEADDDRLYVLKFRGAGQGAKALVAELIAGELARALGLRVPELVRMELDPVLGRNERDPEIRDLINASAGINLGLAYLPGAIAYDPIAPPLVEARLASKIVWFDALVMNVDRTAKNPNLLIWERELWLIDHGAALYFHHSWEDAASRILSPFKQVNNHLLLPRASELQQVDTELRQRLTAARISGILSGVPDAWLAEEPGLKDADAHRTAYARWIGGRLESSSLFLAEALRVRAELV